ncbi:hypothetical protein JG688_00017537 [Phytophthora aleatoria]|uniref:Uncharacterized protein n=1 Tax=Phytophthora aleatoria TaxID=2496075 RepID=A0A8J5IDN4_9STRA|nr:hypothetical protein JG688_00017537 [Phytophthora aleatoria]
MINSTDDFSDLWTKPSTQWSRRLLVLVCGVDTLARDPLRASKYEELEVARRPEYFKKYTLLELLTLASCYGPSFKFNTTGTLRKTEDYAFNTLGQFA